MRIEATLNNNKTISVYQAPVAPEVSGGVLDTIKQKLNALSSAQITLFAVGTLILIAMLIYWLVNASRRRKKQRLAASVIEDEARTVAQAKPMLGWFEFFDGSGKKEPIISAVSRIGRATDNDIVLQNSSVHRQHAILKKDSSGSFTIMDLDTENGVKVNGEHVKSVRLQDSDTIELGEVRMRFKIA